MIGEGPMKEHIERSTEGVIKAEYTTYRIKDGVLIKDTSTRNFHSNGDYNDSYVNEPLASLQD